ncbi:MAG: cob(I)yrinic acid a,c-diamide adenosyltransferase [Desulfovibrionaceae bacterium]|jgi:cob(I)alamin adenosyltransferase|nr:cob(I)yrinic acid a,c-diamide adenosyltransferase [Desulfovibrionaceae bacterium]
MLIIYTGDGKGKTTAATGQTLRALGQGFRVAFGQFIKRADQAGEQRMLEQLLGAENYAAMGLGFYRNPAAKPRHRAAAENLLAWARARIGAGLDMLVLDEALYALGADLVTRAEIEELCDAAARENFHLVLTGRGAPDWLLERADLATEMHKLKHHLDKGIQAQKGIEY